jgi:hypothetical protein
VELADLDGPAVQPGQLKASFTRLGEVTNGLLLSKDSRIKSVERTIEGANSQIAALGRSLNPLAPPTGGVADA